MDNRSLGTKMGTLLVLERGGPFYSVEEARCFLEGKGYSPTEEDNLGEYIRSQVFTTYNQVARRVNHLLGLGLNPNGERMRALAGYVKYVVEKMEPSDGSDKKGLGCCVIWDRSADWNLFSVENGLPNIGLQEVAVIRVSETKQKKGGFRVLYSPQYRDTEDEEGNVISGRSPWKQGPTRRDRA